MTNSQILGGIFLILYFLLMGHLIIGRWPRKKK